MGLQHYSHLRMGRQQPYLKYNSGQEETDTQIIIYCQYALDKGHKYVKIRTPDSDIFWILLH